MGKVMTQTTQKPSKQRNQYTTNIQQNETKCTNEKPVTDAKYK